MTMRSLSRYDDFYLDLVNLQERAMSLLGDDKALPVYRALGEARRAAEEAAPVGWSLADIGVLPVGEWPT